MAPDGFNERRKSPRIKTGLALEIRHPASSTPLRVTTSEISLGGCYIETMFTLEVGTQLEMILWINDEKVPAKGVVATRYPQVGNGINILEMANEDRAKLESFLKTQETLVPKPF